MAQESVKKQLIDKANTRIVVVTAAASVIIMFSLVASYMLLGQLRYQNKVIGQRKDALKTLNKDIEAVDQLKTAYTAFATAPTNILGGVNTDNTGNNGDNPKIILDALPSTYDYPALVNSLEGMVRAQKASITAITGVDDQIAQTQQSSSKPQTVDMPFEITVAGSYESIQNVLNSFDKSIRPIQVQSVQIVGKETGELNATIKAVTYYQPAKLLQIKSEVVKS